MKSTIKQRSRNMQQAYAPHQLGQLIPVHVLSASLSKYVSALSTSGSRALDSIFQGQFIAITCY